MMTDLFDNDLPTAWKISDTDSQKAQRLALICVLSKVSGGVLAAVGGGIAFSIYSINVSAWIILLGFSIALISEIVSWIFNPEKDWYESRALAESIKTLSWRYAVGADPFPVSMSDSDAQKNFTQRIYSVLSELSTERTFSAEDLSFTSAMRNLRYSSFLDKREAYITGRTHNQFDWYQNKAKSNKDLSKCWRLLLILSEITALVLAFGLVSAQWNIDMAGIFGALIAAGTAWVGVKQFEPLSSAYSVAANELAIQEQKLKEGSEIDWPLLIADAEEAISREHTTWLASRIGISRI